jgi:hypothetical protein
VDESKLGIALAEYRKKSEALQTTVAARWPRVESLLSDPVTMRFAFQYLGAAGDLAVTGLEAYAEAAVESRKAAEANRDAEREARVRAEANASAMRRWTVVIAFAALVQAGAVVVQIVRPAPPPVVNVSPPAVHVAGPTINLPPLEPARPAPTPRAKGQPQPHRP